MIRLGDIVNVDYGVISKMWLVKDLGLKKLVDEHKVDSGYYKVLGFQQGSGWWSLSNGTLKQMREYIEQYRVDDKILVEFSKEV